jgi:hypothetical protein
MEQQESTRFSHDDVFPVIARLISAINQRTGDYVLHADLVAGILNDQVGKSIVESARDGDEDGKSPEWWASNMIQWFSQRITEESSDYQSQFVRKKIHGAWAYKPV